MKVDFHFHLEEGPYSASWLHRTVLALERTTPDSELLNSPSHSIDWAKELSKRLAERLETGCFSDDWLHRYFHQGKAKGIEYFGIVDHLYRFEEFRSYYNKYMILDDSPLGRIQQYWLDRVCVSSIEPFISLVEKAKRDGFPVSIGVEADYFPGGEEELKELLSSYKFDYVIGSVHFLEGWGFDNPETQDLFKEKDLTALYAMLFDYVKGAASSGLFHIIAHLDNLKVFNFRPDERKLAPMYEDVAATLKKADVATEINTGLAYRYPVKEACPSRTFLQILHKHGVPITLSSDAHFPDDIGTQLDEAVQMLSDAGYEEIVYFKEGKRIAIPLLD